MCGWYSWNKRAAQDVRYHTVTIPQARHRHHQRMKERNIERNKGKHIGKTRRRNVSCPPEGDVADNTKTSVRSNTATLEPKTECHMTVKINLYLVPGTAVIVL